MGKKKLSAREIDADAHDSALMSSTVKQGDVNHASKGTSTWIGTLTIDWGTMGIGGDEQGSRGIDMAPAGETSRRAEARPDGSAAAEAPQPLTERVEQGRCGEAG